MDCVVKVEPLITNYDLKELSNIFTETPNYSIYAICDPRKTGMFWYCEDGEGQKPKLSLFEEPFYIGQTKNFYKRIIMHNFDMRHFSGQNPLKEEMMREILSEGLEPIFVILREYLYLNEANKLEQEYIKLIGKLESGGSLLNMTNGGDGTPGYKKSLETRRKISVANKGMVKGPVSSEVKKHLSKINKIVSQKYWDELSEEEYLKRCECHARGERNWMYGKKGELAPNFGNVWSDEQKDKSRKIKIKYVWDAIDPKGILYSDIDNIRKFALENNLDKCNIYTSVDKNWKVKGWKFTKKGIYE